MTVWLTDEATAGWRAAPRTTPGGQSCYSPLAIQTALTLHAVFRLALRQTEGLIGSVIGLLGLALAVPRLPSRLAWSMAMIEPVGWADLNHGTIFLTQVSRATRLTPKRGRPP